MLLGRDSTWDGLDSILLTLEPIFDRREHLQNRYVPSVEGLDLFSDGPDLFWKVRNYPGRSRPLFERGRERPKCPKYLHKSARHHRKPRRELIFDVREPSGDGFDHPKRGRDHRRTVRDLAKRVTYHPRDGRYHPGEVGTFPNRSRPSKRKLIGLPDGNARREPMVAWWSGRD